MKAYHSLPLILLALVSSCKSVPQVEPSTGAASAAIESVVDHTGNSVAVIKRDAERIIVETQGVREAIDIQAIPTEALSDSTSTEREAAIQFLDRIDSKAQNIIESANTISKETDKLESLTSEVNRLENSLSSLKIALEQTKAKALEKLYGYISMFWVIGFLLIAGGAAVAFFLNKAYGSSLALIGLLMIGFASAAQYYMQEIALIGAVLLVLGFLTALGMIVWSGINSKRNSIAIREIVEMIQILKETMTDSERERIFGENGVASQVHSDITKEIIEKIKEQNGFTKLEEARKAFSQAPSPQPNDEVK